MSTAYNVIGYVVDQILTEDGALPNATSGDSTNVVEIPAAKSGDLKVVVVAASTTVELASGATLEIRPTVGTTTTPTTVLPSILIKESVQSVDTWLPGAVITEFVIPRSLIGSNKYLKLTFVTSANESADKITAFTTA